MSKKSTKKKETVAKEVKEVQVDMTKYNDLPTTSAKIRAMHADGFDRSTIAKSLGKRYQHVRNVLITPLKKQA